MNNDNYPTGISEYFEYTFLQICSIFKFFQMKKIYSYWGSIQNLIYGKSAQSFEDRLLLLTTLIVTIIITISTLFNFLSGLKDTLVFYTALGVPIYFVLYLYGRFANSRNLFKWITSFVSLGFINLLWFYNYASNGPILPLYIVLFAFMILVFDKKFFLYISAFLLINLFCMYLIEVNFAEEIGFYPDLKTRLMDNYTGMVFNLVVIFSFVAAIKKNYIQEYERAKMSDQLKSAFVANMSHEIRTPLNAIVGFSSLMSDQKITEEDRKIFQEQVEHNSDYLLSLIEDIIDVSKIESNQLTIKVKEIDVVPIIRQITQSFQLTASAKKNVNVIAQLDHEKLLVTVDQVRLEQILRNLLSNAVKFTDEGLIELRCKKDKEFFTFSVKDTGIGIHTDHQLMIFDRFMKIDNNKQHLYRGTGIGLFLSKQLVEMFGGEIWVESVVGKGSTFYFTIPA